MRKSVAEHLIRSEVSKWKSETGFEIASGEMPSFGDFKAWLLNRHPSALSFRSRMGASYDAELWFDEELKQTWRN